MSLPTCDDCAHAARCRSIFPRSWDGAATKCDWSPSRFAAAKGTVVHIGRWDGLYNRTLCRARLDEPGVITSTPRRRPPTCPVCLEAARKLALRGVVDVRWDERVRQYFEATSRLT